MKNNEIIFSTIITIDFEYRQKDILNKLEEIMKQNKVSEIIVSHNDRGTIYDRKLLKLLQETNTKYVSKNFYKDKINNSLLRNEGVKLATKEVVLLLDVDILWDNELFNKKANEVKTNNIPEMLPCLYLTKKGTKEINNKNKNLFYEKYLRYERRYFLHLANPSSVIFLTKEIFNEIEGFNEEYRGHGYEDFDFMIRLFIKTKQLKTYKDLEIDEPYKSYMFSKGFRKYLGMISIQNFLKGDVVYHLYHEKNKNTYKESRNKNKKIFSDKLKEINKVKNEEISLFEYYEKNVEDKERFSVLFDNRQSHMDRNDTIKRKIKNIIKG